MCDLLGELSSRKQFLNKMLELITLCADRCNEKFTLQVSGVTPCDELEEISCDV